MHLLQSSSLRFFLPVLLAWSFAGCSVFSTRDPKAAELHLQLGVGQLQSGSYPQALVTLLKAESLDDQNPVIQNTLGLAYYVREKFEMAEKHMRRAVDLDPKYSDARNNLGQVFLQQGRVADAIQEFKIVENDLTYPSPEKVFYNLSEVYFRMNNFSESIRYVTKTLNVQRESCQARTLLGRNYYEMKNYGKATQELDRAIGLCQKSLFDEPNYYSSLSYYAAGDETKARARLEEMLKLFPNGKYFDKGKEMLEIMKR